MVILPDWVGNILTSKNAKNEFFSKKSDLHDVNVWLEIYCFRLI